MEPERWVVAAPRCLPSSASPPVPWRVSLLLRRLLPKLLCPASVKRTPAVASAAAVAPAPAAAVASAGTTRAVVCIGDEGVGKISRVSNAHKTAEGPWNLVVPFLPG